MTAKVVQFQHIGPVTFLKSRRSKNIKISVKPDQTVRVSFPFFATASEVADFVVKNTDWITGQQRKFDSRKTAIDHDSRIKTKLHQVIFSIGPKNKTRINLDEIKIEVPDLDSPESRTYIENVLVGVYRYEAKRLLPPRLSEFAKKHGFRHSKISVRNNKRNWGSCSSNNNISLNLQMMKLPDHLIDYILLHELVHTKIKNHGPKFWQKLDEITDNKARELAAEVRKYSTYTL